MPKENLINSGLKTIRESITALKTLEKNFPKDFHQIALEILSIKGRVIFSGIGKSGYIANKIAASFSSTGTPAFFIHPAEASHGDLGTITQSDIVFLFSVSGETNELFSIINYCKRFGIKTVAVTMNKNSSLALNTSYLMLIPNEYFEASSEINAPTTSALLMLSLGDALMTAVHEAKGFTKNDFAHYHPGGKIGANLKHVEELMHKGDEIPSVSSHTPMTEAIIIITQKSLGCCAVLENDKLIGIITDGDLRRHMGKNILDQKAADIMTCNPTSIVPETLTTEALGIMNKKSITNLFVVKDSKLVGVLHIHDLLRSGVT